MFYVIFPWIVLLNSALESATFVLNAELSREESLFPGEYPQYWSEAGLAAVLHAIEFTVLADVNGTLFASAALLEWRQCLDSGERLVSSV